jgi:hypothetical protein
MTNDKISAVLAVQKRFNAAVTALHAARKGEGGRYDHPRLTGALRRASMDLTRALADLRKPGG